MNRTLIASILLAVSPLVCVAQRITVPLDGEWQIEDSLDAEALPQHWTHTVPVPGLANLAKPGFPAVDQFDSKEVIANRIRRGLLPASAMVETAGNPRQNRNYFWYTRTFRAPQRRETAILQVNKAQFGTAVWLNGRKIGEHAGCFTAGYFDLTAAIDWQRENRLVIRIGAHPAVLPVSFPSGSDFEKNRWTPGIYDDVSLILADNSVIETLQVAPKIATGEIVVETRLKNYGAAPVSFAVNHRVKEWKSGAPAGAAAGARGKLVGGEEKVLLDRVRIPNAKLWSPEEPFLYTLETTSGGDSRSTRFGMRDFRFQTATRRAYLNGKVYFLRGSNITFHRFLEDPQAGALAWDEKWVRRLLVDIPKRMNWNAFRFCIGPVPERWLDIADEAGLLIQNEFFIWTGHPSWGGGYSRKWDADELIRQYKEWMRDNWNHPSVAIWDANNESEDPIFADKVIPSVRGLDLSNRPWENSYNLPAGPDDPVEDHPYLFSRGWNGGKPFEMTELEDMAGAGHALNTPGGHALINNEYGWLWLLRDGTPTSLTARVYEHLADKSATGAERLALGAYLLAGETEFWRAHRNYAGVLHFVYLSSCYPGAYTCDNFEDMPALKLAPRFADYMREAFKPLGVYLAFWQPELKAGSERRIHVMIVNDRYTASTGKLVLTFENESGAEVARQEQPFSVEPLGQSTYAFAVKAPGAAGKYLLKAAAYAAGEGEPTLSRRQVAIVP